MSEKRFRVRFEQEDGRGEIVNKRGVELTAREVVDLLNEQSDTIEGLILDRYRQEEKLDIARRNLSKQLEKIEELEEENEQLRKELDSFKPVMFQDVRKGTVILYSKRTD